MTHSEALDVYAIRKQFPVLSREVHPGVPLIYLDNAATSQKPQQVIDALQKYYSEQNANIHRGIHHLAEEATSAYEEARGKVAEFVNAQKPAQIIFTRNTTESINLVAQSWGRSNLKSGDMVLLTEMEHHSNIVPWQILAAQLDLRLEYVLVDEHGLLDLAAYAQFLEQRPALVCFAHVSNVLGTVNPALQMVDMAHQAGALALIDGAQAAPHLAIDLDAIGADFYAFSSHKMCGPTGIGVLYGRLDLLEQMPPFLGGGDMIRRVRLHEFSVNAVPHKFEAGTPAIGEAIGYGAAIDFLRSVGMEAIEAHEKRMIGYALERLEEVPGLHVLGPALENRCGLAAFTFDGLHPHDVAQILDRDGVAVRAGHHCAMPLHEKYCIPASTRASFYLYNTPHEIDRLIEGLYKVKEIFA